MKYLDGIKSLGEFTSNQEKFDKTLNSLNSDIVEGVAKDLVRNSLTKINKSNIDKFFKKDYELYKFIWSDVAFLGEGEDVIELDKYKRKWSLTHKLYLESYLGYGKLDNVFIYSSSGTINGEEISEKEFIQYQLNLIDRSINSEEYSGLIKPSIIYKEYLKKKLGRGSKGNQTYSNKTREKKKHNIRYFIEGSKRELYDKYLEGLTIIEFKRYDMNTLLVDNIKDNDLCEGKTFQKISSKTAIPFNSMISGFLWVICEELIGNEKPTSARQLKSIFENSFPNNAGIDISAFYPGLDTKHREQDYIREAYNLLLNQLKSTRNLFN